MINAISSKITRPLRFLKMLLRNTRSAPYDLAKYLMVRLPPSIRQKLKPLENAIAQNLRELLVKDVVKIFGVSEKFVNLYLQGQVPLDWSKPNWQKFSTGLTPLGRMYVEFALSTVIRGREMISLLENYSRIRKKNRYLDVGTGYGGFLRAFKEIGFEEVIGIELGQNLAELALANIDGLQGAQVLIGDFVKDDFSGLGTFDIITCNDVIEHVDDPVLAIQKMSALVNEDGCVSFEVPNRDCIDFVKSDGHFKIFGITQLLKDDAAEYFSAILSREKSEYYYQMGEMYELAWYLEQLAGNGLSTIVADSQRESNIADVPLFITELKEAYQVWQKEKMPGISQAVSQKVITAMDDYIKELELAFSNLSDESSKKKFKIKYLRPFWTIIASRDLSQVKVQHSDHARP